VVHLEVSFPPLLVESLHCGLTLMESNPRAFCRDPIAVFALISRIASMSVAGAVNTGLSSFRKVTLHLFRRRGCYHLSSPPPLIFQLRVSFNKHFFTPPGAPPTIGAGNTQKLPLPHPMNADACVTNLLFALFDAFRYSIFPVLFCTLVRPFCSSYCGPPFILPFPGFRALLGLRLAD